MRAFSRFATHALALLALIALTTQPAAAQSILQDAETEALLNDMAAPLVEAAGLEPGNVEMVLIGDRSINAFVAGGQAVTVCAKMTKLPSGLCLRCIHYRLFLE